MSATKFVTGRYTVIALTCVAVAVMAPAPYVGSRMSELAASDTGLAAHYATQPQWVITVLYIHMVTAGVALGIGPLQFSTYIRSRWLRGHRVVGRVYVLAVLPAGVSGLIVSAFSAAGLAGLFGFGTLALLWLTFTARGTLWAFRGDIARHQAWMIRGFAMTYAAVTLRAWQMVLMGVIEASGGSGDVFARAYAPVPFLCWIPNLIVAEYLISRRGLPGLRYVVPRPTAAAVASPVSQTSGSVIT
ncbi:DUF2306 domain-containing protein [Gordonia sp. VNQ95]|uniref:DUF2306 domain-containing protein n=1 Tax=Gordonia TaxID=2053 RepID=UPI0032B5441A